MKRIILATIVLLMCASSIVLAQEAELHGVLDLTYQSKYIWRGFDIFGDRSAIQPSVDLDLYGTGFGLNVMGHMANSGGHGTDDRWDYTLYYGNSLYPNETYQTNYRLDYVYYNYPDKSASSHDTTDLQEINSILSWPRLLGVEGLVPTYVLVKLWPSQSSTAVGADSSSTGTASGFAHIFMLDYALPVTGFLPDVPEQVLNLHTEVIYNDGVGPGGQNVDHDWSNAVFGVSTDFELDNDVTLTPGLYHQITMDDSVNPDGDETWLSVSLKYAF